MPRVAFSLSRSESSGATCWQKARDGGGVQLGMRAARELCLRPLTFVCTRCSFSLSLSAPAGELCQQTCEMRWKIELDTARGHFAGKHPRHSRWRAFSTAATAQGKAENIYFPPVHTRSALLGHLGRHSLNQNLVWAKTPFLLQGTQHIIKVAINYLILP